MELNELKSMWQAHDEKLEKTLKLNLHFIELIQAQKVRSKLAPIFWQRLIETILHGIVLVLLLAFLYSNFSQFPYAVSALALIAFYTIAFTGSLKQLIIIKRMDYSNDIVTIQSSLVMLQTHSVNLMRLIVLCMPIFLAYPMVVSEAITDLNLNALSFLDLRAQYHGNWWMVQMIATIALTPLCIWLYTQVSYKNIHKAWVKNTLRQYSGARVVKAIEFVQELESLKK